MAKFTYKEIKQIIETTPAELKNKSTTDKIFEGALQVGYYKPAQANWGYQVFAVQFDGQIVLCAAVFGWIK